MSKETDAQARWRQHSEYVQSMTATHRGAETREEQLRNIAHARRDYN